MADSQRRNKMEVKLFKKTSKYIDKDNQEKQATRFYVQCGDALIPVEVTYFKDKETGKDDKYASRREVMKAFASEFSQKEVKMNKSPNSDSSDGN